MQTLTNEMGISKLRQIANDSASFEDCVRRYQREGLSEGQAIQTAAKYRSNEYNAWCAKGRPAIQFVRR